MAKIHKVLVTGSSGFIGKQICPFLESRGFRLRGYDIRTSGNVEDFVEGRLEDMTTLRSAVRGMDTVIHLAACADDADFVTKLVPSNVIGIYNIFEAARIEKVRRIILASSVQTVNWEKQSNKFNVTDRFPTNFYGLLKIWAEDLGRMYSYLYSLSVIATRIGWIVRDKRDFDMIRNTPRGRMLFLSYNDAKEFFFRCLLAPKINFAVLYALSRQPDEELFDMDPTRRLIGFEPRDIFPGGLTFDLE